MKPYIYDQSMVDEMLIIMNNNYDCYSTIETINDMYTTEKVTYAQVAHACSYMFDLFTNIWCEIESTDYILQPEYFKAASMFAFETMQSMRCKTV